MNKLNISEIIQERQKKNKNIQSERIENLLNCSPEYSQLIQQRNRLMGQIGIAKLTNQLGDINKKKQEVALLDKKEKEILAQNNLPLDYLDEIYDCPICKDMGYLEDGKVCSCIKKLIRQNKYSNYDLSESFKNSTFENFNLELFSKEPYKETGISPYEAMIEMLNIAHNFCKKFPHEQTSYYIQGDVGVGKTYYVSCIVNELINKDIDIIYISAPNLLNYLYDDIKHQNDLASSHKEEFKNIELLVIDDLGTENSNNFSASSLSEIIDYRIINNKCTLITSNYSPSTMMQNHVYPERMASRILAYFKVLPFIGSDLRVKKNR